MVTLRNGVGHEIEVEGDGVDELVDSMQAVFKALVRTTTMLSLLVKDHIDREHAGQAGAADCGIVEQLLHNAALINQIDRITGNLGPGEATSH